MSLLLDSLLLFYFLFFIFLDSLHLGTYVCLMSEKKKQLERLRGKCME